MVVSKMLVVLVVADRTCWLESIPAISPSDVADEFCRSHVWLFLVAVLLSLFPLACALKLCI